MASQEQQAQLLAYTDVVKGIYRTSLIGYALATSLYGISLAQTFFYARHYSKDSWNVKLTVFLLWSLDTVATALVTASLYIYLITNFGKPVLEMDVIPIPFAVENGIMTAIIFVVQMFYVYQIWNVSKNRPITFVIVILTILAFALGVRDTYLIYQKPNLATLAVKSDNVVRGAIKGVTVLADIIIASSLIYFFQSNRTGIKRTRNILDQLILYAASRGALLTLCQILYFIMFTAFPDKTFWLPVHQLISKVYINSVLASLNVRRSFQKVRGMNSIQDSLAYRQDHELSSTYAIKTMKNTVDTSVQSAGVVVSKQVERTSDPELYPGKL